MAGAAGGFFAGLTEAFGSTLLDQKAKKHQEEIDRNKELSNLYLEGVFSGKIKPETGFGEFSKIVAPILTGEEGGKGKKSGDMAGQIAALMTGLHKGLGVVPPSAGTAPLSNSPTTEGADGELPSRSSMTSQAGSTPPGLAGLLITPEQTAAREEKVFETRERFKTNESIRAANEEGRYAASKDRAPTGPVGQATQQYLADAGYTWATAPPEVRQEGLRSATAKITSDRNAAIAGKLPTGPVGQRVQRELGKMGKTWPTASQSERDTAMRIASTALEQEDQQKLQTARTKSLLEIQKDEESLRVMKAQAPLTLKLKELNISLDEKRLAAAAKTSTANPAPMLEAARKFAHTAILQREKNKGWWASLKETLGVGAGADPTEDELTDQIIQEWTGEDGDTLRQRATEKYSGAGASPSSGAFKKDASGNYVISTQ